MTPVRRAVIPAAGRGTRMMPLTADCPKPLLPVAGVPMLERILRGLRQAGITEAVLITGYRHAMIEAYFGDGAAWGMQLDYRLQDPPNGTGGALMQAEALCGDEPLLLHWGDILIDPANYPALLAAYTDAPTPPACVMGLNWMDDPCAGAAVYRDGERVTRVVEKPAPGSSTSHWNAAGINVLSPRIWPYVHQLTPSPRGEYEFTDVPRMLIAQDEVVLGFELTGLWSDVGTPAALEALNADPRLRRGV